MARGARPANVTPFAVLLASFTAAWFPSGAAAGDSTELPVRERGTAQIRTLAADPDASAESGQRIDPPADEPSESAGRRAGNEFVAAMLLNAIPFGVGSFLMGDYRGGALIATTDALALSMFALSGEPADWVAHTLFTASRLHAVARPLMLRIFPPEAVTRTLPPKTFATSLLNFVPGFGIGSFLEGDARYGAALLGGDVLAIGLITGGMALWRHGTEGQYFTGTQFAASFVVAGGVTLAVTSRAAGLGIPWLRQSAKIRVMPTPVAAVSAHGERVPGLVVSFAF